MTTVAPPPTRPPSRFRQPWASPFRFLAALRPSRPPLAAITHLYAVDRATGDLLDTIIVTSTADSPFIASDQRAVTSMAAYLLAFLRNPEHLERYAALRHVRIESRTYGIFATETKVLLVVLEGRRGIPACLRRCSNLLAGMTTPDISLQEFLQQADDGR